MTKLTNSTASGTVFVVKKVNLYEAKTHLSELVERAAAGEEIVIAKAGRPRARLMPIASKVRRRKPGGWRGKAWISADFDEPVPPEVLAGFLGEEP
jgi:prevent-host-death family protein